MVEEKEKELCTCTEDIDHHDEEKKKLFTHLPASCYQKQNNISSTDNTDSNNTLTWMYLITFHSYT